MVRMTRRSALGAGAALPLAGAFGALAGPAVAQGAMSENAKKRGFMLGDMEVSTLLAGTRTVEEPQGTFGMNVSPEEFADKLIARLHGMARAYALLAQSHWSAVALRDLVQTEADVFGRERIRTEGPDLRLPPRDALALGMVLHELATNAAKYGALSNDAGLVQIRWRQEAQQVLLHWQESGGPQVRPPVENGFGFKLIDGQVTAQMDGEIDTTFAPEGLQIKLRFPLRV